VLQEKVSRLGTVKQFPDRGWECFFSIWKDYVDSTGDHLCVEHPLTPVRKWAADVHEQLVRLSAPLPWHTANRKHLYNPSRERACTLAAMPRLIAAGFPATHKTLTDSDLLAAKLSKAAQLPLCSLTLRTVLRILSGRTRTGLLPNELRDTLVAHGLGWCPMRQAWRQIAAANRAGGELVKSIERVKPVHRVKSAQPVQLVKTPRVANKPNPPLSKGESRQLLHAQRANSITEESSALKGLVAKLISASAWTNESQLFHHPALLGFRKAIGAARMRTELSFVTYLLHQEGAITYLREAAVGMPWGPFRSPG